MTSTRHDQINSKAAPRTPQGTLQATRTVKTAEAVQPKIVLQQVSSKVQPPAKRRKKANKREMKVCDFHVPLSLKKGESEKIESRKIPLTSIPNHVIVVSSFLIISCTGKYNYSYGANRTPPLSAMTSLLPTALQ